MNEEFKVVDKALYYGKDESIRGKFTWNPNLNTYQLNDSSYAPKTLKIIDVVTFFRIKEKAIDPKEVFPEYDSNIHSIGLSYSTSNGYGSKTIFNVTLSEKIPNNMNTDEISFGTYELNRTLDEGYTLTPKTFESDNFIKFRTNTQSIEELLLKFKSNRTNYQKGGIRHKQALLLYGSPGNGKTCEIMQILKNSKQNEVISIIIPKQTSMCSLNYIRSAFDGTRTIVFILEEITSYLQEDSKIADLLTFLDGEESWDNCFVIATTNYPEVLPFNVIDRPGRFSHKIEFPNPTTEEKVTYLVEKGYSKEEALKCAEISKDMSLDYIVQSMIHSKIEGISLESYLTQNIDLRRRIKKGFSNRTDIGIK